jgi:uncharacterized protein (TIGR02145 family)
VPSNDEVNTLIDYLGGSRSAWIKLIESGTVHWNDFSNPSTNESGFTALPGRVRYSDGSFNGAPEAAIWWTSTANDYESGRAWGVVTGAAVEFIDYTVKVQGFSIRCIKN